MISNIIIEDVTAESEQLSAICQIETVDANPPTLTSCTKTAYKDGY